MFVGSAGRLGVSLVRCEGAGDGGQPSDALCDSLEALALLCCHHEDLFWYTLLYKTIILKAMAWTIDIDKDRCMGGFRAGVYNGIGNIGTSIFDCADGIGTSTSAQAMWPSSLVVKW